MRERERKRAKKVKQLNNNKINEHIALMRYDIGKKPFFQRFSFENVFTIVRKLFVYVSHINALCDKCGKMMCKAIKPIKILHLTTRDYLTNMFFCLSGANSTRFNFTCCRPTFIYYYYRNNRQIHL